MAKTSYDWLCGKARHIVYAIYLAEKNKGLYNNEYAVSKVVYGSKNIVLKSRGLDMNSISATWWLSRCSRSMGVESNVVIHVSINNDIAGKTNVDKKVGRAVKYLSKKPYWSVLERYLRMLCDDLGGKEDGDVVEKIYAEYNTVNWSDIIECWYDNAFYYRDNGVYTFVSFANGIH